MASYSYRCRDDRTVFDVAAPIGTASSHEMCPQCGSQAGRVISAPRISLAPRSTMRLLDRAAGSAHEPDVVTTLPSRNRRGAGALTGNPALRGLPRP